MKIFNYEYVILLNELGEKLKDLFDLKDEEVNNIKHIIHKEIEKIIK